MCNLCNFSWPGTAKVAGQAPDQRRRHFLQAGALAAAASWGPSSALAAQPAGKAAPNAITPAAALKRLMEGNQRYVANKPNERDFSAGRAARALVQYPVAAIVSCADSRLAPEFAFDQGPGELFVTRLAGNYVAPSVLSALEYAVAVLGVPLVLVLGHTNCGAVDAAVKSVDSRSMLPGTMQDLVSAIQPAVVRAQGGTGGSLLDRAIVENVKMQEQALETRPSLVQSMFQDKKIEIAGGVYDLRSGKITLV